MYELELRYPIGTTIVHNNKVMRISGISIASFGSHYQLVAKEGMQLYSIPVPLLNETNCELVGREKVEPQIIVYKFKPRDFVKAIVGYHIGGEVMNLDIFEGIDYKYTVEHHASYYTESELEKIERK